MIGPVQHQHQSPELLIMTHDSGHVHEFRSFQRLFYSDLRS
jgi:hypothetical protein